MRQWAEGWKIDAFTLICALPVPKILGFEHLKVLALRVSTRRLIISTTKFPTTNVVQSFRASGAERWAENTTIKRILTLKEQAVIFIKFSKKWEVVHPWCECSVCNRSKWCEHGQSWLLCTNAPWRPRPSFLYLPGLLKGQGPKA